MEAIFDSLGKEIYHIHGHKGYVIRWNLIAPFCKKWSRNREPDMQRVDEIVEHYNKGGYVPRIIHLAEIEGEGMVCYDGNHRKEVFNRCHDDNVLCVVDVMFGTTQNEVYKAFNNINKSVQLPAIFIEEPHDDAHVKEEILRLVKSYETKYKPYLSTSARCHAPHFNRDAFIDVVYNLYTSLGCVVTVSQIATLLERLNAEYAKGNMCRPHSMYKPAVIEKCKKHDFWLFIDRTIPVEHVEKLLHEQK